MIEIGTYKCIHYNTNDNERECSDVSGCLDYIYDDQFDENECYQECYLKEICYEKHCERFK